MRKFTSLLLLIVGILFYSNTAFAQIDEETIAQNRPTTYLSANVFEGATMISAKYEQLFAMRTTRFLAAGVGVGMAGDLSDFRSKNKYVTLPHHFSFNTGKEKHFLEIGFTASYIPGNEDKSYQFGPLFGYRFQPIQSGKLNARIFSSVPFLKTDPDMFYSALGISIGFSF